jgi:apolipoprotein D and lipocalin family protein
MMSDPRSELPLEERIAAAEAEVARRDENFLRRLDTFADGIALVARRGASLLGIGGVALSLLLLWSGRHGRSSVASAPHAPDAAHPPRQPSRWLALAGVLAPWLRAAARQAGLPTGLSGWIGLLLPLLPKLRERSKPAPNGVRAVAELDLGRYAGDWFEYARLPAGADAPCRGNVKASYAPGIDGTLQLVQRCVDRDGRDRQQRGIVRSARGGPAGRLRVSFAPRWLDWLDWFWADHQVLYVDRDYRHALVGTSDRRRLWLLARTPTIERPMLQQLVELAQVHGYDIERLQRTPQAW